ncbi:hypothetical protein EZ428_11590 [Pedobacter frigiditerrae]|uniref:F5/8 type C domain-containing protein n=1 Tax=Pedobacter frigiditerrae TaxID=2530452 RepID=A0A4R0MYE9_9SPHI|nr:DUF4998 domain-containing protein [Pedobacter frigiditerrae]TCC92361.1 hypothetical protein EZ428_11590 [Pedobacter frigiditerrae]
MKIIFNITFICFISIVFFGCKKYDDDYLTYLDNKEIKYSGKIAKSGYNTGNLRAELFWNPSPDPSITKYVITWNNGASKLELAATSHNPSDIVRVVVPNLEEYVYSFSVVSYDNEGNKSIATEINNVRVFGATYIATLLNRAINTSEPYSFLSDGKLQLNFNKRDTMNVATTIRYTNTLGAIEERQLLANDNSIVIPNYKTGTGIQYRSSYIPEVGAIDVFNVAQFSDFPTIIKITECDKSLFKEVNLPTDITSEYGWILPHLWDNTTGQDQGFHTGGSGMPQWFTIDLGQTVTLDNFRLWQRENALYDVGNLKVFEVWGSTNPNSNGSWDSWTKLQTFTSVKPSGLPAGQTSDGDKTFAKAGEKFIFPTTIPNVRYIRIKVLQTWGGASYLHLTELTFYKRN